MLDLIHISKTIQQIARTAGAAILDIYNNPALWNVERKADNSVLTQADKCSNELICDALIAAFPHIPLISEENADIPYAERQHFDAVWLIDPLDGTREFTERNDEFSVNIALIQARTVVAGCVYVPCSDTMFAASKGNGAWVTVGDQNPQKLVATEFAWQPNAVRVVRSRGHHNSETQAFIDQLQPKELIPMGASLKFLYIALGKADVYPRLHTKMKEWDVAANQIIVEEAGGVVLDWDTREPLRYNKPELLVKSFLTKGRDNGTLPTV